MALPPGFVLEEPNVNLPDGFVLEQAPPPPEKQSAFRQVADIPLGIAKGATQGVRMIADAFGAGSDTSNAIKGAEGYLSALMSAQSKNDQQEIARIMKDAEDKSVLEEVKAAVKAFTIAPVDTLSSALGTAAPVIVGALGAKILGAGALLTTGVSALTGAGMGAGTVKGSIYEETKRALQEIGASEQEAERRAQLAQEYGGKNLDQILLGTAFGGAAAVGPLEKGAAGILARRILGRAALDEADVVAAQAAKGAIRRRAEAGLLEAAPEALQAGQEQVAQNIALQREGFDVPTFRGAAGAATLEALAGAGLGVTIGGGRPEVAPEVPPAEAPETPVAEAPSAQLTPAQQRELEQQRALAERPKRTEELLAEVPLQTGRPTTPEDIARIRDEHETAVIEGLLAQDAAMDRANALARRQLELESEAETTAAGISDVDARVREGRIFANVQDLIDRNVPFASTAISDINQKFTRINEAPLTDDERARVENIMGMVNTFTNFVNLPVLPPKPVDRFAENQQLEALIKERTERGQAQPLRAAPVAPSPRIEEAPVSQGIGESTTVRPTSGVEPSVAEDRELVTAAPVAPSIAELRQKIDQAEELSPTWQVRTDELRRAVAQDIEQTIAANEMPVFVSKSGLTNVITPSAQQPGMFQLTRYNKTGAIGDSQYKTIEAAILDNNLQDATKLTKDLADAHMAKLVEAEAKYQAAAQAAPVAPPPQQKQAPRSGLPDTEVGGAPATATAPANKLQDQPTFVVGNVAEVPVNKLALSKDVPQFKSDANQSGVVQESKLEGKFDRRLAAPIQVWQRLNGNMEVISGRHRLDLAQRSGEQTIPAQIHKESDGFNADMARMLDIELNVKDGRGKVKDYVSFFKEFGLTKEQARADGLLNTAVGRQAYTIADAGSPSLIAAHANKTISDEAATSIAINAPKDEALQNLGMKQIQEGKTINHAVNFMRSAMAAGFQGKEGSGDLFGFDDSFAKEAEAITKEATKQQRDAKQQLSAIKGAANKPELARRGGVDVKNLEQTQAKIAELEKLVSDLDNFHTNPEMYKKLRADAGLEVLTAPTPEGLKAADERAKAEERRIAAEKQAAEDKAKADAEVGEFGLTGSDRPADANPDQESMFSLGGAKAQRTNFEQTLRTLLNRFGLKDVGLSIIQGMQDSGSYAQQLIRIAASADNPVRTLRHEAIHALRELGFFTDAQWKSLSKMAKDKWIDQYLKQRNVDGKPLKAGEESRYDAYMREYEGNMEKITEEAVADAFADFEANKPPAGMLASLLKRMKDLFQSIKSALTQVESPEQIFGKVEKGELKAGTREVRGEAKSLRDRATANFKRWFGDSKVVDEDGEPLVVYHGTGADIDAFRGRRIYFAEKPEYASTFAGQSDEYRRPNIVPAYLSVKNPLDLTSLGSDFVSTADIVRALESAGATNTAQAVKDRQFEKYGRKQGINVWELWFESPILEAAKDDGFDGVMQIEQAAKSPDEMHDSRVFMVFRPEQIKSAIGNNGEYSLTDADIRKSLGGVKAAAQKAMQKQPTPEKGLGHVSQDLQKLAQPIFFPQNKTVLDRIDGMKDKFWQKLAQKTADQFRTIKEYSKEAYMQARLSKSIDGGLEGLLFHGQVFDDGGALNIKEKTKGMMEILKPIGTELDSYLMWVALNRESLLPEPKRSRLPNMADLVNRRAEFAAGTLNGKPRVEVYEDVLKQMNQLNKSVLNIALAKGIINKEGYEKFSKDIYYIPFYRHMEEDGTISGAQTASGLTSQYFSKELKGGEAPFGDLMENIVRNWSHILSASMKNQAAKSTIDAAVKLQAAEPNLKTGLEWRDGQVYSVQSGKPIAAKFDADGKQISAEGELRPDLTTSAVGMAKIMVDGQPMYFKVTDDLLMDSISSIGYLGPKSKFLDVARGFKNMLQYGVTASPIFKVNNLIRDSVSALAVSDLKKTPIANVMQGISLSKPDSPTYISALAGGGIFNFGSAYEGDQAKLIKRLIDQGVGEDTILDNKDKIVKALKKTWDAYQHLGDRSEAANRLALYQQLRGPNNEGMSHLEASFMARDLLDFSMQGSWPAFRLLTQVVPFMNARIQGLYKLGRDGINPTVRVIYNATTGKQIDPTDKAAMSRAEADKIRAAQFATVTSAVMLASALLYLTFKDDEDYKKRDAWDRDNFWWFKIPTLDIAFRIPKPFEVGAFGTLTERTLEQILDQGAEGKQFGDSLTRTLWDTFALNPLPQMFKPLVDIYSNKDSFSGAPIESAGLERLSKQERVTDQTSPLAIALGGVSSLFPEKFELSPVQVDYAIKGYFGWLGAMASLSSTYAMMPFKEGEYPDARWLDRASLGLVRDLPAPQSAYVTAFYDSAKEISQAYADMRHYAEMGDSEKVQALLEKEGDKIALAKFYDKTSKTIANVRKQIQLITNDKNMDGAEKKEMIERMKLIMSDLAKQAEETRKSMKQ